MEKFNVNAKAKITNVDYCKDNPSFYRGTVRILTSNVLANRTVFTDEAIEKAIPSLVNVPIVALYKEDEQTLGGHEVEYEITKEEGLVISYGTHPIGIIPESAQVWFEDVIENGVQRRYLCADVLLWKREKVYRLFKKKRSFGVSMEIQILSRNKHEEYDEITEFYFTAIAVLGKEAPAFKSANIRIFSEEDTFQQMLHDLKDYMEYSLKNGGEGMEDVLKEVAETVEENETVEETKEVEEVVEATESTEEQPNEEVVEVEEVVETVETVIDPPNETVTDAPTYADDKEEDKVAEEDKSSDEESKDGEEADKEEEKEEDKEDAQALYTALQADYGRLSEELALKEQAYTDLMADYEALKMAHDELAVFKQGIEAEQRTQAEDNLFARFADLQDDEGYESLKANAKEFSLEELETQLYALAGKQLFSLRQTKQTETHSVVLENTRHSKPNSAFSILDKYLK